MGRFRPHRMYPGALLAQECCSYQAMTELLARLGGDVVVLIHSDRDCSNVLPKTGGRVRAFHPEKFLCTNLTEDEMVTGQGNRKLRRAIELVHEAWSPGLIVVLSTCPTVMIGDNIKNVTRKAGRELGVRAVAEITHGLKPKSPAEVVDQLYCTLSRPAEPDPTWTADEVARRVALVGVSLRPDERAEVAAVLTALGFELAVVLDEQAEVADFLRLRTVGTVVHPGPNMLLKLQEQVRGWGLTCVEVPLPFGVDASDRFWRRVGDALGCDAADIARATARWRDPAVAAVAAFREGDHAAAPLRLAYNIGSIRSFDLRRIALEELGELPLFAELGFDVRLFIQGPAHDANGQRTAQVLADLGVDAGFDLFADPGGLANVVEPGVWSLFFGARFLRKQLTQVNLPLLDKDALGLGYGAVPDNVEAVTLALRDRFYRHFAPTAPDARGNPQPPAPPGQQIATADLGLAGGTP